MKRFSVTTLFAVVLAFVLVGVTARDSRSSEICWVTEQLKTTAGVYTKTFAGVQDSAFYPLPNGISMDGPSLGSTTAPGWARLTFVITGAGVNLADTVRYQIIPYGGGTRAFVSLVEQTAATGNIALTAGGKVFLGVLLMTSASVGTAAQHIFPSASNSILKVAGDPNAALNSVQVFLTYPKRCGSR
jgi:hypothetical protein